jgi:hypothetical protein
MDQWSETILQVLPDSGRPVARCDVEVLCTQALARELDQGAFRKSLAGLSRRRLISSDSRSLWRVEPDFEERALEEGVEKFLASTDCLSSLRIVDGTFVLQNTTMSGAAGSGRWSRPDFTLATVRRFRYDPRRYLDVFSFELKNRNGATLVAVHEALAHSRLSHYSYLVCPRSTLRPADTNVIRQACADHAIGLITFELDASDEGSARLTSFRFDVMPQRRSPDPAEIDANLDARLSLENQQRLVMLAGEY